MAVPKILPGHHDETKEEEGKSFKFDDLSFLPSASANKFAGGGFDGEQDDEEGGASLRLTSFLTFSSPDEQRRWSAQHLRRKLFLLGVGSGVSMLYFAGTLLAKLFLHSSALEYHMGGVEWMLASFLLSFCGMTTFFSIHFVLSNERKLQTSKTLATKRLWVAKRLPVILFVGLYPPIVLRCASFCVASYNILWSLKDALQYSDSSVDMQGNITAPPTLYLEYTAFWVYIFMGQGLLTCNAEVPFHVIAPIFILGVGTFLAAVYLCYLWNFLPIVLDTMLLVGTGLACTGLLFFHVKKNMQHYAISKQMDSALVRARRLAVDAVRQRVAAADRVTREKTLVFGQLAHDLGTPLAALSMAVELLEGHEPPPPPSAAGGGGGGGGGGAAGAAVWPSGAAGLNGSFGPQAVTERAGMVAAPGAAAAAAPAAAAEGRPPLLDGRAPVVTVLPAAAATAAAAAAAAAAAGGGKEEEEDEAEQQRAEAFEAVRASVASMVVLRQAMLDYVKKASGVVLKPSLEVISASEIVHSAYLVLKQLLARTGSVRPRYVLDPRLARARVVSSKSWLLDMLLNYVSNAVKFTAAGEICISARCAADPTTGRALAVFEVRDTGRGVAPAHRARLFRSFGQLQRDAGGTGLGLASVKQKATILGGDAGHRGAPGGGPGSVFYFHVPLEPLHTEGAVVHGGGEAAATGGSGGGGGDALLHWTTSPASSLDPYHLPNSSPRGLPGPPFQSPGSGRGAGPSHFGRAGSSAHTLARKAAGAADGGLRRVMIVDDSELLLKLYSRIIKNKGEVEVVTANSGAAALEAFQKNPERIDLILMDDEMPPGERGPEIAKKVMKRCESLGIPCPSVFICSGGSRHLLESDFPDIYKYVHDILTKPLSPTTIARLLKHCLLGWQPDPLPSPSTMGGGSTLGDSSGGRVGGHSGGGAPCSSDGGGGGGGGGGRRRRPTSALASSRSGRGGSSTMSPLFTTQERDEQSLGGASNSVNGSSVYAFGSIEIEEARTIRGQLLANALKHSSGKRLGGNSQSPAAFSQKEKSTSQRSLGSGRGNGPKDHLRQASSKRLPSLLGNGGERYGGDRHGSRLSSLSTSDRAGSAYLPKSSPLHSMKKRMNFARHDAKSRSRAQQLPALKSAEAVYAAPFFGEEDKASPSHSADFGRPHPIRPAVIHSQEFVISGEFTVDDIGPKKTNPPFSSGRRHSSISQQDSSVSRNTGRTVSSDSSTVVMLKKKPVFLKREPRNEFYFSEESSTLGDGSSKTSFTDCHTTNTSDEAKENGILNSHFLQSPTKQQEKVRVDEEGGHDHQTAAGIHHNDTLRLPVLVWKGEQNRAGEAKRVFYLSDDETTTCPDETTTEPETDRLNTESTFDSNKDSQCSSENHFVIVRRKHTSHKSSSFSVENDVYSSFDQPPKKKNDDHQSNKSNGDGNGDDVAGMTISSVASVHSEEERKSDKTPPFA